MKRNGSAYRPYLFAIILSFVAISAFSQTTYYSRNSATLPRNWDEADSWTLNSDGSGPAAVVPTTTDHVVILAGHTMVVDDLDENGSPGAAPDDLADPLVGPFTASNVVCFYHAGDVTIELGGTLDVNQRLMLSGSSFIYGNIDVDGDLINLGDMIMPVGSSFLSTDDLIISGASNTRIDNLSAATFDDLYIDNTVATLCGTGGLAVGVNPNVSEVRFFNSATINQICSVFTVTGCVTCPLTGTGPLPPGPSLSGTGTDINYIENSIVNVDDALEVTYTSGPFLTSAVFSVSNNYVQGEDVIAFTSTIWITELWDPVTGTLTLSGYGNESDWETALRSITYENVSDNPTASTRTLDFVISDGFTSSNTLSRNIIVNPVNDPPDLGTISGSSSPLDYFEGDGVVAIDDQITVDDPDDTDFESAVVTIANFQASEDNFSFTNQNGITGVIVGNTLTMTGTSSLANYETALRSITFENTSEDPNTITRTVSFVVNDGDANSLPFERDIIIHPVNDPPSITTTAPTTATEDILYTYTAGVSDVDDNNDGTELTWTLTNEPAGMVVSSTGVVTWTPTEGVLTSGAVTLTVADGGEDGAVPDFEIFTITVTAVNDGPVITTTAPTTATEEVLYTYAAGVSDPEDSNDGVELTWSLTNAPAGMVVSSTGVVTWTPQEGVLTSGAVTLTVADGGEDGAPPGVEIFTITVTPVNDGPTITTTAPTTATEDIQYVYAAGVNDVDDNNDGVELTWTLTNEPAGMVVSSTGVVTWTPTEGVLTSGTVTLTVADGGEDGALPDSEDFTITVTPVNDGPIITTTAPTTATEDILYTYTAGVFDPEDSNDGVELTWSLSNEPAGMVVSSLGVVTWTPTEGVLTSGAVTLSVADGGEDGALPGTEVFTITVTPVNDGPDIIINGSPGTVLDITTDEDTPLAVTLTVDDPEDDVVSVVSGISLTGSGTISTDTNPLTFIYTPEQDFFGAETLNVEVCDDGTPIQCVTLTVNATVNPVNDEPEVTSTVIVLNYNELQGPTPLNNQFTPSDVDDTDLEGAVIEMNSNYVSTEDVFDFTDQNGITGVVSGNTVTLSGTSSMANYQTALRSITYENTSGTPDVSVRNVQVTVNDGELNSFGFDVQIVITPFVEPPVLTNTPGILNYTEGDGAVVIDNSIGITDGDDIVLDFAEISFTNNYQAGEDILGFTNQFGLSSSFDAGTGILTLTGSATIADYQTALNTITYENLSADPSSLTRTVSWMVNDGDINSNLVSFDIGVTPTNSPPDAVDDNFTGDEDGGDVTGNILANDSDPEDDQITLNTTPMNGPTGGTVVINPDGSIVYTPDENFFGSDTFEYEICDDGNPVACATALVTITISEIIDLKVFQAVSPNSDGLNDTWQIQDIHKYPNNRVRLFDRWNNLVFEETGYNNDEKAWAGVSNQSGKDLPSGTYFYSIDLGDGSEALKGFIVLKR